MSNIWFTADHHFGHRNIIDHCERPYSSVEEMDENMIQRWNEVVGRTDTVYHLGDVGMGSDTHTLECVSRLNGRKILVWGNHDSVHPRHSKAMARQQTWAKYFAAQTMMAQVKLAGGRKILLSHYPYTEDHTEEARDMQWRPPNTGMFLLHGHVHNLWLMKEGQLNVGVDVHNFYPVSIDEVAKVVKFHYESMDAIDEAEHDKTIDGMAKALWGGPCPGRVSPEAWEAAVEREYEYERERREGA